MTVNVRVHFKDYRMEEYEISEQAGIDLVEKLSNDFVEASITLNDEKLAIEKISDIGIENIQYNGQTQSVMFNFPRQAGKEIEQLTLNILPTTSEIRLTKREEQLLQHALINIISFLNEIIMQADMNAGTLATYPENLGVTISFDTAITAQQQQEFTQRLVNESRLLIDSVELPYEVTVEF